MFDGNKFCPPYPECIEQYIDFMDQDLTDTDCFSCDDEDVYDLWGTCYHVDYTVELDFFNNELTGEIPQEIENFVNLNYLDLQMQMQGIRVSL